MAEKRMFTQKIIDSDAFLEMPLSAQALYFHLNMRADDDGFVNNPKKIARMINASEDDLKILIVKRFLIAFESGVIVIKHWRMHNSLRMDRYHPTDYTEEFSRIGIKENNAYTDNPDHAFIPALNSGNQLATKCQPVGNQMEPENRLDKNRIDKNRLESICEEDSRMRDMRERNNVTPLLRDSYGEIEKEKEIEIDKKSIEKKRFVPPTLEDVRAYCKERNSSVDPLKFFEYYTAGNWKDSKGNPVRNWKQKLITWERRDENGRADVKSSSAKVSGGNKKKPTGGFKYDV